MLYGLCIEKKKEGNAFIVQNHSSFWYCNRIEIHINLLIMMYQEWYKNDWPSVKNT